MLDIATLLKVQSVIKEVQENMCEAENSQDYFELIKEVCQACDYEIFCLINEAKKIDIMERLSISDDTYQVTVCKILAGHNERLVCLEENKNLEYDKLVARVIKLENLNTPEESF